MALRGMKGFMHTIDCGAQHHHEENTGKKSDRDAVEHSLLLIPVPLMTNFASGFLEGVNKEVLLLCQEVFDNSPGIPLREP
jgi:hypothetical protein